MANKNGKNNSRNSSAGKNTKGSATSSNAKASNAAARKKTKVQVKKEKERKKWIVRIVATMIIGVILAVSLLLETNINAYLRLKGFIEEDYSGLSNSQVLGEGVTKIGEKLNVHFVDVGQGDACIIELPDDKKIIIDGGKDKEKQKLLTYIDENIEKNDGKGIKKFDYAILTHSDEDHCGGLDDVLNKYPADVFYRPNQLSSYNNYNDPGKGLLTGDLNKYAKNTLAYMRVIEAGHKANTVIVTDARKNSQNIIKPLGLDEGDGEYYTINFYTPTKDNYPDVNDYSPIIILEYQGKRIVLSGDAEKEAEAEFVELAKKREGRYAIFTDTYSVDLIKLGHHGSRTSSSDDYINALTTTANLQNVIFVISCGAGNSYKHPHSEVLTRLKDMGVKEENILRTDTNGNVVMSIREDDAAVYQLYYGAELVRLSYNKPIAWREIAIIIFVGIFCLLIVTPLATKHGKKLKVK